jgi:hypothetical protein
MKFTRLFVPLIIFAGICTAQSADNSEKKSEAIATKPTQPPSAESSSLHLTIMKTVISPELINGIAERGCDEDGNVYLGSDSAIQPAIRKFNANGELVATFKPDTIPDVKFGFAGHFFVAPDGELYQLVGAKDSFNRYVLIFKNDGSFKSSIKLDPGFVWSPASFSVFPHGEILLTGQQFAKVNGTFRPAIPFTGIVSADGRLLKRLDLEGDGQLKDAALASTAPATAPPTDHTIGGGHVVAARDGNLYVMRYQSPARISVISPGGEILRNFQVAPDTPGAMPIEMLISGTRMAIVFNDHHKSTMKIVDLEGNEVATYDLSLPGGKTKSEYLGALSCYSSIPERFTFIRQGDQEKIHLQQVEAR